MVDYEIDECAKYKTDDHLLSIHNKIVKPEEVSGYTQKHAESNNFTFFNTKRLVADHSNQKKYLVSLDRLRVLVKHGVNVTRIYSRFKFVQQAILEDFIKGYFEKRKNATFASRKNLYKLLNNTIFGKFFSIIVNITPTPNL